MKFLSSLFSVTGLFFVVIAIIIAIIILVIITLKSTTEAHKILKIFMYIIGGIVLTAAAGFILLSPFKSRSKVDISPLRSLKDIPHVDSEALDSIIQDIAVNEAFGTITEQKGPFRNIKRKYTFVYDLADDSGYVEIDFYYYDNADDSLERLGTKERGYVRTKVSDKVTADLGDSEMIRNADQLYAAFWKKDTRTQIMLGNLFLYFSETSDFFSAGKATSEAIEALSEIIIDATGK